ncbi:MAG: VapC toxin family PIN domain ribonuclease [Burkholderiales bacterium]|nr:VapC toxin family PIN domain ribonuclease [Burkholderiales bacterium]MDE2398427.1 VapC toxin family PIN domain ribonuclease [Burkholderiales bacterium]MDE2457585.1 VapC toxin family PIN domain ribonuclease [Burkholderiales bacterium]
MTVYLLDVNVLIALVDPAHVQHDQAHDWFARVGHRGFATCPLTENGLIRIVGHPKYPNSPGPPSVVVQSLVAIRGLPGHKFWSDDVSIADAGFFVPELLSSHSRVTDGYLLALAHAKGGRLATMDQKLATEVVPGGKKALALIQPN